LIARSASEILYLIGYQRRVFLGCWEKVVTEERINLAAGSQPQKASSRDASDQGSPTWARRE
jgi:hypothetical protein